MAKFYDTCALLNELHQAFKSDEIFYISSFTLKELENIKTSDKKDSDTKFRARRLIHLLDENEDKYNIVLYKTEWDNFFKNLTFLSNDNDSRIIISAYFLQKKGYDIKFVTADSCCKRLAAAAGLDTEYLTEEDKSDYVGFKEVILDEEGLANFYSTVLISKENILNLNINEYFIIKDINNEILDKYKWTEDGLKQIPFTTFESKMFGKVKPKDIYQQIAMDSMRKNKLTMVRGSAGTGKSYLSFGYLFECLDKGIIDKIIIFCNTVATSGSAKLGLIEMGKAQV